MASVGSNGTSLDSPAWHPFARPRSGWSKRRAVRRAGLAQPDERLWRAPQMSLARHANEALPMSNSSSAPHIDGNGLGHLEMAVLGLFAFSACRLEMIFTSLVEIISKCPAHPPLRGTTCVGRRRPVQAVAAPCRWQLDPCSRELACRRPRSDLGAVVWHT
jgi:hypothetical protein